MFETDGDHLSFQLYNKFVYEHQDKTSNENSVPSPREIPLRCLPITLFSDTDLIPHHTNVHQYSLNAN
jgi:hypothetical protein